MLVLAHERDKCPLCSRTTPVLELTDADGLRITCGMCGEFMISNDFNATTDIEDEKIVCRDDTVTPAEEFSIPIHIFRGLLKENTINKREAPYLDLKASRQAEFHTLAAFVSSFSVPETPTAKIDKLLENLAKDSNYQVGNSFSMRFAQHQNLIYAKNENEFELLINGANELGYLGSLTRDGHTKTYQFQLTIKAWERIHELKNLNEASQQGFIAHKFSGYPEDVLEAIKKGITDAEFKPLSLKGINFPETILSKGLGEINRSRFVVADLTYESNSVIFEAGYAFGRGIQVILIVERSYWDAHKTELEFYVKNYNIKTYGSAAEAAEVVERAVRERIN